MAEGVRVTWDGPNARAKIRRGLERGVRRAADRLGSASLRVVPREDDTLARSQAVTAEDLVAAVSYDTPYAVRQHENLRLRHARGQTGKYLENPLIAGGSAYLADIAAEVKRETEA